MKIIADVLTTARDYGVEEGGVGVTTLLRKANLPHSRLSHMLKKLVSSGLLEMSIEERGSKYRISEKGMRFLEAYSRFEEFSHSFGLRI